MLKVKNLNFSYKNNSKKNTEVLKDINLHIKKGESVAILGNNGTGKSTLVKCLNKILKADTGNIKIDGIDIKNLSRREIAKKIAYVSQEESYSHMLVYEMVLLGREPYLKYNFTEKDHQIVSKVIQDMEIGDLSMKYMDELSGGQAQKVLMARALAQEPEILILDEPTNNLDIRSQHHLLYTIENLVKTKNLTAIAVLHDLNHALRYCSRYILLKDGKIYKDGKSEIITSNLIQEVFGLDVIIEEIKGHKTLIPIHDEI